MMVNIIEIGIVGMHVVYYCPLAAARRGKFSPLDSEK
jgi:hypothetical protein